MSTGARTPNSLLAEIQARVTAKSENQETEENSEKSGPEEQGGSSAAKQQS